MDGDVKQSTVSLTIGATTRYYGLWVTNAPAAYDYGTTLHVYGDATITGQHDDERLVLIPEIDGFGPREQTLRYRTGMYVARPSDLLGATGQGGLEEILWGAIHTLHRSQD